jgi:hypothetical protein
MADNVAMTTAKRFIDQPPRPVPPTARRWDWHAAVYLGAILAVLPTELHGILVNRRQRQEVASGHRATLDYRHRTWTECWTAVFGWHPDDVGAPWAKTRRALSTMFLAWFGPHIEGKM